ncbi:hypothetical protein [Methylorubrum zatmanii]
MAAAIQVEQTDRGSPEHIRRCRLHAIRRAAERYGLRFTVQDVIEHEEMIRLRLAKLLGTSRQGALYEIQGEHRAYYAVYIPRFSVIATYLRARHEWIGSLRRAR